MAVGSAQVRPSNAKGVLTDTFSDLERLRNESRGRPVVLVGIVDPVVVELDLTVVEVEDRGVREVAISVRIIARVRPCHRNSKVILTGNKAQSRS